MEDEILNGATLSDMQRVHWLHPSWQSGWGLGFQIIHTPERDLVGHGGLWTGYATSTFISAKEKIGVIALANTFDAQTMPGSAWSVNDRLFEWLAPSISKARKGVSNEEMGPDYSIYKGRYEIDWGEFYVLQLEGDLVLFNPNSPNPKAVMTLLIPIEEHSFSIESSGFDPLGETAVFEFNDQNNVTRLNLGPYVLNKKE